jgi:SAM-dependent methyltransferase
VIKYALAAAALKGSSLTPGTRTAYRRLGNVVETARRRQRDVPDYYIDEAIRISQLTQAYGLISDGDRVFELGTGFVHWESIVAKLCADVRLTMFDVVDNRLWGVFPKYLMALRDALPQIALGEERKANAYQLIDELLRARSFNEAYEALGAEYILNANGSTAAVESESYALVISLAVLEHIQSEILSEVISETYRMLRPGGYALHGFDLSDHYWYFDSSMPRKNYLRFSPASWDRWFSSRVMYINRDRVQRPEWDDIFKRANFEIVDCEIVREPLGGIGVHPAYGLSPDDAQTMSLRYLLRRP